MLNATNLAGRIDTRTRLVDHGVSCLKFLQFISNQIRNQLLSLSTRGAITNCDQIDFVLFYPDG